MELSLLFCLLALCFFWKIPESYKTRVQSSEIYFTNKSDIECLISFSHGTNWKYVCSWFNFVYFVLIKLQWAKKFGSQISSSHHNKLIISWRFELIHCKPYYINCACPIVCTYAYAKRNAAPCIATRRTVGAVTPVKVF